MCFCLSLICVDLPGLLSCCGQDLWIIWTLCELKERRCILGAVYLISRLLRRFEVCDTVNYARKLDVGDCQKRDLFFPPIGINSLTLVAEELKGKKTTRSSF